MDPICHTLAGATLAESGLKRWSAWGTTTLILAANAPDIDVFAYATGSVFALGARRGWTHGLLALLLLPLILAAIIWSVDRLRNREPALRARFRGLFLLAAVGVLSHPLLDFMNVYGIRLLMPFADEWFYGDTLFIVDPWMWAILTAGIAFTMRKRRNGSADPERAAGLALVVASIYVVGMGVGRWTARSMVEESVVDTRDARLMVAPARVDPLRKFWVADDGETYRLGEVRLIPPAVTVYDRVVPKRLAEAGAAANTQRGATFLDWARFPFVEIEQRRDSTIVYIIDARYTLDRDASFGAVRVALPNAPASAGAS